MKKDKKQYEAPSLTAVSFKTERGYAASSATLIITEVERLFQFESSNPNVTQYTEDDSWASYTWND